MLGGGVAVFGPDDIVELVQKELSRVGTHALTGLVPIDCRRACSDDCKKRPRWSIILELRSAGGSYWMLIDLLRSSEFGGWSRWQSRETMRSSNKVSRSCSTSSSRPKMDSQRRWLAFSGVSGVSNTSGGSKVARDIFAGTCGTFLVVCDGDCRSQCWE